MSLSPSPEPLPSGQSESPEPSGIPTLPDTFHLSPLIRITLLGLYSALLLPLPILAQVTQAPIDPRVLALGAIAGGLLLYGALSETVVVTEQGIAVQYPAWVRLILRKGWFLPWGSIRSLKPRSTGQGGLVYYLVSHDEQAYLLPMRIAGFARLVRHIQAKTGLDTQDVRPLAQPWMYLILLGMTGILLLVDIWTIWTAQTLGSSH